MKHIDVISKGTHKILDSKMVANEISLTENSVVIINASIKDILKIERVNNALIIHFKDGEVLRIENYYDDQNTLDNSLVLKEDGGQLIWIQKLENIGVIDNEIHYQVLDNVEPLLYNEDGSQYAAALPWLTGGVLVAAIAYHDKDHSQPKIQPLDSPIEITTYVDDVGSKKAEFDITMPTDDTTPSFVVGTYEDNLTPILYVDGVEVASKYDRETGLLTPEEPLSEGEHLISYGVKDKDGNLSDPCSPAQLVIDTTPPDKPDSITNYVDDVGSAKDKFSFINTDSSTAETVTDDTTPSFVIGTIPDDETVTLYVDGKPVESTYDKDKGTLTPKVPLSEGDHEISYSLTDEAGNESELSEPVVITVDTTAPSAVQIDEVIDDQINLTGPLSSGDYTNDTKPTFNGSGAEAGALISLKDENGKVIGTAVADAKGEWSVEPNDANKLSDGLHSLTVTQTDAAGNESPADSFDVIVDTQAPSQTTFITDIQDNEGAKQGKVDNNGYTDDLSPTINGTISAALGVNEKVVIYRDGKYIGEASIDPNDPKVWHYQDKELENGKPYQYTARVEDSAGNRGGDSNTYNITIDNDPPPQTISISSMTDNVAPVQGDFASGVTTDDSTPQLNGSLSQALAGNEYIVIYRDGVQINTVTVAAGSTTWSYTDGGLTNNTSYTYTAKIEDGSGLQSAASNEFKLTFKNDGPTNTGTITGVYDDVDPYIGNIDNNGTTNDTTPLLQGSLKEPLAAGEKVAIFRDGVKIGEATVDATGKGWSYQDHDLVNGEKYTYSVAVETAAGKPGAESTSYTITIDTLPPPQTIQITEVYDNKTPEIGKVANGGVTNDDTPEIRGSLSGALNAGESVFVYRDEQYIGTATVNADNTWSYIDSSLGSGQTYLYTAKVVDLASNESSVSNGYSITTNFNPPPQTITIIRVMDDVEPKTGAVDNNGYTNDTTPRLEGSIGSALSAGDEIIISCNGDEVGTATVQNATQWYYEGHLVGDATYTYTAVIRNSAGVDGAPSNSYTITLDTAPPPATANIYSYTDDVAPQTGEFLSGSKTNDTSPTLNISVTGILATGDVVAVYRDGAKIGNASLSGGVYRYTDNSALQDGHSYKYTTCIEDAAGNKGTFSSEFTISIDTVPASAVQIDEVIDDQINLTGPLSSGDYTNDTQPTVNGSGAEAGALISLKDENGKVLGTATAEADGTWSVEPSDANKLSDGLHSLTVTQTDAAGNESPADSFDVIVDTQAPSQTTFITDIQDNEGAKQGKVDNNGYTDDLSPTINGTISAALGVNEKVVIYRDGKYIGEASIDPNDPKVWHYQDKELENGKPYQYTARVEDSAGNRGGDSNAYNITIDNDPPPQTISITSMSDNEGPIAGDFASGVTTDDSTPQLNGSLSQALAGNEYIVIYRDGVQIATVTVAAGSTTWSYTDGGLKNNTSYTYTAKIEDGSGLQSTASNEFNLTFKNDGSTNTGTITGVHDDVDPFVGNILNNGYTNDTTPLLQGSLTEPLAAGEKVAIFRDGVKIGEATVDATGKGWSYQDHDLVNGEKYTYSVAVETAAGKPGAESISYTINIDTLPPPQTIQITEVYDNKTPEIGKVANGGVTNDDTPEIRGSLSGALNAGESVFVYRDEQYIGTATVNADNTWSYIDSSLGSGQTYLYTAKVVDLASNESSVSNGYSITTNFNPPPQTITIIRVMDDVEPKTGAVDNNGYTNDTTPRLEGSIGSALSAGDEIIISCNGDEVGTATVQNATQWYYEGHLVGDATYTYTAVIRNSAGVDGAPSNSYTITLDTAPPPATANIYSYTDDVAPQTGEFLSGSKTNDTSPTLNISVTGILATGDVVAVYRDGAKIGNASLSGGVYRYTDNSALQDGHSYKYTTCIEDAAGNKGTFSSEFTISIDTVPASAVQIDEVIDDQINLTGPLSSGDYTNDTQPTVNGSGAEAGALISLKDENGKVLGTATAEADGTWSVEPSDANKLSDGLHSLTVTQTDAAGNESPADSFDVIVDTQAPSQTTFITDIQDNEGAKQGKVDNNGYTDDLSPTINGTISAALGVNEKVVIYRDGKYIGEASIDPNDPKVWHYQDKELENGKPYQYTARVEDSAGNRGGDSNAYNITIDNDPPPQTISITSMSDNEGPIAGDFASGVTTDDSTPQLNGSLSQALAGNEYIVIYRDGVQIATVTVAAGSTTWSYTDGGLKNNTSYTYTAKIEDGSGLQSTASNEFNLTFKNDGSTNTGTITGVHDDVDPFVGNILNNGYTNDTTPLLQGSLTEPLAAGEKVAIFRDGVKIGEATVDATGKGWSYQDHDLVNGEKYTYSVAVETAAGKPGAESISYTINIDTLPPPQTIQITEVYDNKTPEIGKVANGGVTNDDTPEIRGSLSGALNAGESVFVYRDEQYIGTATVNADNTWSYIDSSLGSGQTYLYTAKVVDLASNESSVSNGYSITTNFNPPPQTITIIRVMDDVEPKTGAVDNNGYTNDTTPRLEGSIGSALSAGDEIIISCNGDEVGTATVQNATQWYYEGHLVGDATYTYTAVIRNSAGVDGAPSNSYTITLDTAPPPATANIYSYTDDVAPQTGEFLSGSKTNDTSPTLNISVTGILATGDVVAVYRDGAKIGNASLSGGVYRYTDNSALQDGHSYKYTTCIEDAAGNKGTFSSEFTISIDTVPASAVQIDEVIDDQINLTGPLSSGDYTNDTQPTVNGSGAEAGALISLKDENGKVLGTATAEADGTWSVEPSDANKLSDGLHSLTVTQTDAAGNESPADSFDVIVDTQAPSQTTFITDIQDNEGAKQGKVDNNGYTDDLSPTINGTISAALGVNEKVVIYRDGKYIGEASIDPNDPKVWHYQDKELENGKPYQYTARVEDSAGNRGGDSNAYNITIDNDPPPQTISITSMSDNEGPIAGDFASGVTTDDSTPQLNGSLSQALAGNEYIVIYRDGVQIATVTVAAGSTTWSYTDGGLKNNTSYTYTAKIEDGSGLQSTASNEFNLTFKNDGSTNTGTITGVHDDVDPFVGNILNNGYTNDTTPLLQGSLTEPLAAGEKVAIFRDGVKIGEATVDATGKGWSYQDHDLVNGEKYTYSVAVETAAGKPGAESISYTINIDTLPPPQTIQITEVYDNKTPEIGKVANGGVTNDDTPEIRGSLSGALNAGESVFVYRDEQYIGTATVNADNTWSYIDSSLGSGQTYLYTAKVVDLASNESSVSNGYSITTNFNPPPQTITIIRVMDDVEPKTGAVDNNGYTNDTTPRLEGSIGSALSAGDEIIISCNGDEVGTATVQNATQWYYEGHLVGDATYTYTAVIRNSAGVDGAPSNSYTITLDTAPPPATSNIYSYTDDVAPQTGEFLSGSKSNDTSPTLNISVTGILAIGDVVAVYRDGVKVGNASLSGGVYRYTDNGALQDGHSYKYTTCIEDAAGNKGKFSSEFIIAIDLVPPPPPIDPIKSYIDDVGEKTGSFTITEITDDTKPAFVIGDVVGTGEIPYLYIDGKKVDAIYDADSGTLTPVNELTNGNHKLTYTVVDAAGNESAQSPESVVTIFSDNNPQPPKPTQYVDDVDPVQGTFGTGTSTNDTKPGVIIGTVPAGNTPALYVDGAKVEANYDPVAGTLTPKNPLLEGEHNITYTLTNPAGNESPKSDPIKVIVDTTPPDQPVATKYLDNVDPIQGEFGTGTLTNDATPGIIIGTVPAGETPTLYVDGAKVEADYDPVAKTLTPKTSLPDGEHNLSYTLTDQAGNESLKSDPIKVIVDASPIDQPTTPTQYVDNVDPVQGTFGTGTSTNDAMPSVIIGAVPVGNTPSLYVDGNSVESVYDPVTSTLTPKVPLGEGEHNLSYTLTNPTGTESPKSDPIKIIVDITAPDQPTTPTQYLDNVDPNQGAFATGTQTNDATPSVVIGVVPEGDTPKLYVDGQPVESVYDAATKTLTPKEPLADGEHNLSYTLTDPAGNESVQSDPIKVIIDTVPPDQPNAPAQYIDDTDPQTGTFDTDTPTNDPTPSIIIDPLKDGETAVLYVDGQPVESVYDAEKGTLTPVDPLDEGSHDITYSVVDVAGNESLQSNPDHPLTIVIDETEPPVLTIVSYTDDQVYQISDPRVGDKGTFEFDSSNHTSKFTNDRTPTINGRGAEPNALITLKDELNNILGTSIADADGNWSVTPINMLDKGDYQKTLYVTETDKAGNESPSVHCVLNIDTSSPIPVPTSVFASDDTGTIISSDQVKTNTSPLTTTDISPTLTGQTSIALSENEGVAIFRDGSFVGLATKTSSTTWTFTDTTIDFSKYVASPATVKYFAQTIDAAGNLGGSTRNIPVTIDFTTTPTLKMGEMMSDNSESQTDKSGLTTFSSLLMPSTATFITRAAPRISKLATISEIQNNDTQTTESINNNGYTNDSTPLLQGSINAELDTGEKVVVYRNNILVGEAKVAGTSWTFEDQGLTDSTQYIYTVAVQSALGVIGSPSAEYTINVDTVAPTQEVVITQIFDNKNPDVYALTNGAQTNDDRPEIRGTLSQILAEGEEVVILRNGEEVGTADVNGTAWTFEDAGLANYETYTYTALVRDIAGNTSKESNSFTIEIDYDTPPQGLIITYAQDNTDPVQGQVWSNGFTNDKTPTLSGSISADLKNGEVIVIYRDNVEVGTVTTITGTLDWIFEDTILVDGTYSYTSTIRDTINNTESSPSIAFVLNVDTVNPTATASFVSYLDNVEAQTGIFLNNTSTNDRSPTLNLKVSEAIGGNEEVRVYRNGQDIGKATTVDGTNYTFTDNGLVDGVTYTYTTRVVDAASNAGVLSSEFNITVDLTPPAQPVAPMEYIDDIGSIQGTFGTDTVTDDTKPALKIGITDETPTLYVDGQAVDSTYDPVEGTLTPVAALTDGSHDLSYTLTDAAGNESIESEAVTVIVDTVPPVQPVAPSEYIDNVDPLTGKFVTDTTTNDTTPSLIIGAVAAGETPTLYVDGVKVAATYDPVEGTLTPVAALTDGSHDLSYTLTDIVGNESLPSDSITVIVDTIPPVQPAAPTQYQDNVDPVSGIFGTGTVTNDATPSVIIGTIPSGETPTLYVDGKAVDAIYDAINGMLTPVEALDEGSHNLSYTLTDKAGNESAASNPINIIVDTIPPAQPDVPLQYVDDAGLSQGVFVSDTETDDTTPGIIIGNIPTNETPTLYVDGQKVDSIYDPVAQTLTPVTALDDGTHNFTYTLTDAASNESAQSEPIVITIDTLPPVVTGISTTMVLSVDTADGVTDAGYTSTITASNQDLITRDNTPEYVTGVLSNALNAGEMLQISKDGGVTWEDVTILSGVNWSYRFNDVYSTDTTLEFAFRVRDNASNYSELGNQNRTVTIDLTGPNAISVQPKLAAQLDTKTTYTFSSSQYGTAEPGTKIALINDVNNNGMWQEGLDKVIAYAIVDANGQWTISTKLPAGDLTLGFMVWDKAGNISDLSPTTSTEVKSGGESSNNAGFEVLATNWGGTTDGEGYGVNCAAVTVNADGSYSFWQSVRGTKTSCCSSTANAGRVYSATDLYSYTSTYLAQANKTNGAGYNLDNCCYGQFVSSAVFADINRDGNADVMSQLSSYGNCGYTAYWMNNGDGTYSAKAFYQGTLNHLGGVIAYDRTGDGYLDFVLADSCSDSITFIKNTSGTLTYETSNITCTSNGMPQSAVLTIKNGVGTASVTGTAIPKDLSILHDVAGVDLDNNGTIDIVAHVDYNGTKLYGDCSRGMGILYNSGTSAGFTYINKANIFTDDGGTDYGNLQQSIVFADYNGDGWLDMFISRGSKGGCDSNESRIYLNDGTGKLNASDTQALWFGDNLSGGSAFAVDWNMDGKQDLIEVPAQVSGCAIKTGFAPTLYLNTGNDIWGKNALSMTTTKYTDITGATAVDYDWDGAVDLVLYRAGTDAGVVASSNNAPSILIHNTGVAADGTSLHVKIVDGQGINCYYGNTVQLYDSKGNLVATQVINAQSSASTDSTGIVNFYGLNPNDTYSVQLLRITNGVSNNVGGLSHLGGYVNNTINAAWTGLVAGKANEAYVLTAESDTAANNSSNGVGVVGTGYNDHLYASLGNDHYNGGGGWKTNTDGTQSWVANGGADILDYSKVNAQITIDVTAGTVTKVFNGAIYKDTFENIEQFVGGKGDTTFTGSSADNIFTSGAGKDTFDITSGGSDTIVFNLLDKADATGGNGSDVVNGFHIGKVGADSNADVINIHDLLSNYSGTAGLYADTDALKLDIASSELNKYLQVTNDGTDTYINVNINGTGHDYATVLTLHDVKTDLLTLLANNQLVI